MSNKLATKVLTLLAIFILLVPILAEARGGRGGGGGGGRGGRGTYGGGNNISRSTPTMSRTSNRSVSLRDNQNQARQSFSQNRVTQPRQNFSQNRDIQSRQNFQQRPSSTNTTQLKNQIQQYSQNRATQRIDNQTISQKAQNFSNSRANQIAQNREISDRVNQRLQQTNPNARNWFDHNFFNEHNIKPSYWNDRVNWWRPAAWGALATWGAWRWSTPYYYDTSGDVYPLSTTSSTVDSYNNSNYSTPQTTTPMPNSPQATQDSMQSLNQTQTSNTTEGDWLPLGVFAVANSASSAPQTNRFMQLAINRNGEIAGVVYNSATDVAQDLTGMVDSNTQKAFWSLSNRPNSPIASTGIFNLTEDQTQINVHFSDNTDQMWTLVRLKQ